MRVNINKQRYESRLYLTTCDPLSPVGSWESLAHTLGQCQLHSVTSQSRAWSIRERLSKLYLWLVSTKHFLHPATVVTLCHTHYPIFDLYKIGIGLVRWLSGYRGPTTKADNLSLFPGPTWWKQRIDSHKLSSTPHIYTVACVLLRTCVRHTPPYTHTLHVTMSI